MAGSRLFTWLSWLLRRPSDAPRPLPADRDPARPADPQSDEAFVATYLRRIGPLDERPRQADPQALAALERLWQAEQEATATRLGVALAEALPDDLRLQLRVAELLWRQRFGDAARPLLQRVVAHASGNGQAERLRARSLLAELATAAGRPAEAAGELTQILAEDWDHPGALERLRAERAPWAAPAPVTAPLPDGGRLLAAVPTLHGEGAAAGRFRLKRELGCGRDGTVYLADEVELGIEVALKLYHTPASPGASPGLHEARLLSSLHHPGVLFLYELDPAGRYLTMEVCEGGSLRRRLATGQLPLGEALRRAGELCETLQAVHGLGIVHGDIKPENLLFRGPLRSLRATEHPELGDLVLGDFGVARRLAEAGADGAGAGTLGYLAPERLHGAPPSAAADLYSVGVVLGEMLLGEGAPTTTLRQKLDGRTAAALLGRLGAQGELGPQGDALLALLGRLLSPTPAERPDASATRTELGRLLAVLGPPEER